MQVQAESAPGLQATVLSRPKRATTLLLRALHSACQSDPRTEARAAAHRRLRIAYQKLIAADAYCDVLRNPVRQ